jgi:DNA-binding CsgD family transcriptional regulator
VDPIAAVRSQPGSRILAPRELTVESIEHMLRSALGEDVDEPFAQACHASTGGNPLLLAELLQELAEAGVAPCAANVEQIGVLGPRRVRDAVLRRLGRLTPPAQQLARALSLLGDGASLVSAAALSGLDEPGAVLAASELKASDLLADDPNLSFAHPIIRAAIYQSVLPAERAIRHAQAARLLRDLGSPAEQVAAHILLADQLDEPWVAEQLQLAADAALALGAPRSAIAYLEPALARAHSDSQRSGLLAQLGRADVLAGRPEAPAHLEEAIRATADTDVRARIAITLAQLLKFTGRAPAAVGVLDALEPVADEQLRQRVRIEALSNAHTSRAAHDLLEDRIAGLQDDGEEASTDWRQFELVFLALERVLDNRPVGEALDLLARAGPPVSSGEEQVVLPPGMITRGAVLMYCDRLDQAHGLFTEVIERSRTRGAMTSLVLGLGLRSEVGYRRGDLGQAVSDATEAFDLARRVAATTTILVLLPIGVLNGVAVEQGTSASELRGLLARTDENLEFDPPQASITAFMRARVLSALGESEQALDQLLSLAELGRTAGVGTPAYSPWRSAAALILRDLGDAAAAQRLAEEELELAQAMGAHRPKGIALRACGMVRSPPDVELLGRAVAELEQSSARLEHARALIDLGASLRRSGERVASREPLHQGYELAVRCQAGSLEERALSELAASGMRVASRGLTGPEALTPSERRVAELAARGQSNRDIAQALFITEKTVETHLGHAYDKLGVRSRHKLVDVLPMPDAALA